MTDPRTDGLGVAVIGYEFMGRAHSNAWRNVGAFYPDTPAVRQQTLVGRDADRVQAVAAELGWADTATDWREVLERDDIDIVDICTPGHLHAEIALAALRAGKHVLVEKPIARTLAEAEELQRIVEQHDTVVQVGFVRRHSPNCQVLKSFIDADELGEIYYAKASCIRRNGNPGGWFADKEIAGGGPLLDIGVHVLDLAWYLMGSPKAVAVSGTTAHRLGNRAHITTMPRYQVADYDPAKNSVEDMAGAMIRFENGAVLMLDCSYSLHATRDSIAVSIHGDKGGADLEPSLQIASEMHGSVVNITPQISSGTFEMGPGFAAEIANFVQTCQGRAESVAPAWHGVEVVRLLEAIYRSAEEGREISLV